MVTSSAVVGSSAIISLGCTASAYDHHPLPHAPLIWWVILDPRLRCRDVHQPEVSITGFESPASKLLVQPDTSPLVSHVKHGFREVMAPESHGDLASPDLSILDSGFHEIYAFEQDLSLQ